MFISIIIAITMLFVFSINSFAAPNIYTQFSRFGRYIQKQVEVAAKYVKKDENLPFVYDWFTSFMYFVC